MHYPYTLYTYTRLLSNLCMETHVHPKMTKRGTFAAVARATIHACETSIARAGLEGDTFCNGAAFSWTQLARCGSSRSVCAWRTSTTVHWPVACLKSPTCLRRADQEEAVSRSGKTWIERCRGRSSKMAYDLGTTRRYYCRPAQRSQGRTGSRQSARYLPSRSCSPGREGKL